MAKATMRVDAAVFKVFGQKLYEGHALPIVARELLQNSVDACAGIPRDLDIVVEISYPKSRENVQLCVRDNGCGMDIDTLLTKFLCLGGTTKLQGLTVGGLGIAIAAIVSCDWWQIHTHNLYVDRDMMSEGKDVRENEPWLDGTEVKVRIDDWASWNVDEALQIIFTSAFPAGVTLRISRLGGAWEIVKNAGHHPEKMTRLGDGDGWIADAEMETPYMLNVLHGANVIRIRGLTQFVNRYNANRVNNIFINLLTDELPTSKTYPLTMSRERLQGKIGEQVNGFLQMHNANAFASELATRNPVKTREKISKGYLTRGMRFGKVQAGETYVHPMTMEAVVGAIIAGRGMANEADIAKGSFKSPSMMITRYKGDPSTAAWHAKVLRAWMALITTVAGNDEEFGFGLTGEEGVKAERYRFGGDTFYIINPNYFPNSGNKEATLLHMWEVACHEAAHATRDLHDDYFAMVQSQIADMTAATFYASMKQLRRLL